MAKRSTVATVDKLPLLLLLLLSFYFVGVLSSTAHPGYDADGAASSGLGPSEDDLKVVRRESYDDGRIIDITHRYVEDMPSWESPNGIGQFLWLRSSMKNGSLANNSEMKMQTHTGTHVDAPGHVFQHYFEAGFDVDTLDLGVLNGPTLLVDVPRNKNLTEFDTSYVGFMKDGAQWLVDNTDIKLVGVDYLSVAAYDDLIPSHIVFLKNRDIILVEALKLDGVEVGIYSLHCLPLRLLGAEGCPSDAY